MAKRRKPPSRIPLPEVANPYINMKRKLLVLLGLLFLAAPAAMQAQSGSGDGYNYSINASNTNTITITLYTGSGGAVTIPTNINGLLVTSIGSNAFTESSDGPWDLTGVTISGSVTSIGSDAFGACESLTGVTIPNSVTNIGNDAFPDCYSLINVTIGSGVTSIGDNAFYLCYNLTSITIPDSLTSIGDNAFDACGLTSLTVPNSLTSIGPGAFCNCGSLAAITVDTNNPAYISVAGVLFNQSQTALIQYPAGKAGTSYTIPNSVTNIGNYAFSDCTSLASVTISPSVISLGDDAFNECFNLTSVTIPNSDTNIGDYAFSDCTSLTNITIGNSVSNIGSYAFDDCSSLTNVTIPGSVTSIGADAFDYCSSLTGVFFESNAPAAYSPDFLYDFNATVYYLPNTSGWSSNFAGLPTSMWYPPGPFGYTIGNGTITITAYLGSGGAVTIPSEINNVLVTSIGTGAFADTSLTGVTMGTNITSMGDGAFENCTRLASVTIPNSVTNIGDETFWGCTSLISVTIGNSVTSIGEDAFLACTSLASITIPASVTSIDSGAFADTSLTGVTIGTNITSIGPAAFDGQRMTAITVAAQNLFYSSVDGVLFDKSQTTLVEYPRGLLGSYIIPNSVTNIGDGAFENAYLTNVSIPNSVTSIGEEAFGYCPNLTSITIPNSVTSLGAYAFSEEDYEGPGSLTNVTIGNSVTNIGNQAFGGCNSLLSVTIGNRVANISAYAFDGCTSLTTITIPNSVTNIGDYAFDGCTNLASVYFEGNAPAADSTVFYDDVNDVTLNTTAYYLAGTTGWADFSANTGLTVMPWIPGSLQVTITPTNAVSGGAQWQVDSGPGENSGVTLTNLTAGSHIVSFTPISGFATPAPQTITITSGETTTTSGVYTVVPAGALSVTLLPASAVSAGAQWQVDSGTNENSGATVTNLSAGIHTLSFTPISGWITPANQIVTITSGATTMAGGIYAAFAPGTTVFPIATNGAASEAGIFAAFGRTNYLVGIQGDGTTNNTAISAQLISTNGTLAGSRILPGRTGGIPYVAFDGTNFLLVWSDDSLVATGGNDQVYGQFVSQTGTLVGSPFTFGPTSEEQDMQGGGGSLLAFDGNNYLAVWDTGGFHDSPGGDIHGALFSQTGSLVAPIIPLTSETNGALAPNVAFGKTNYLVVWNNRRATGPEEYDIYGEFISTNGTQGIAFVISQTPTPSYDPCCAAFDGTNFMVVWSKNIGSASPNTIWNLYGRVVSADGTLPGNEVAMVTDPNDPELPSLAFDGANYLLAWSVGELSTNSQIVFQFFNQAGSAIGPEFYPFSPTGTNVPLAGGVLFDGRRFEITAAVGGGLGIGSEGAAFTSSTGTYGTFLSTTDAELQPSVAVETASQTIAVGGNVTFSVTVVGTAPLSYAWYRNGANIAAATNSSYTINNVQLVDSGSQFVCVISNAYGSVTSSVVTLTVAVPVPITGIKLSGANLVLNGVNGQSGAMYYVLMSTNLTLPLSQWTCVATNVLSASGNFTITVTNTVTRNVPQRFYRMVLLNGTLTTVVSPVIQTVRRSGSSCTFTWSTVTNQMYQIQATASLAPANWTNLGGTITATNSSMTVSEPIGGNSQQFYRVVLLP